MRVPTAIQNRIEKYLPTLEKLSEAEERKEREALTAKRAEAFQRLHDLEDQEVEANARHAEMLNQSHKRLIAAKQAFERAKQDHNAMARFVNRQDQGIRAPQDKAARDLRQAIDPKLAEFLDWLTMESAQLVEKAEPIKTTWETGARNRITGQKVYEHSFDWGLVERRRNAIKAAQEEANEAIMMPLDANEIDHLIERLKNTVPSS